MVLRNASRPIDLVRIPLQVQVHQHVQSRLHHLRQFHIDVLHIIAMHLHHLSLSQLAQFQRHAHLLLPALLAPPALRLLIVFVVVTLPNQLLCYPSHTTHTLTFLVHIEDAVTPALHTLSRLLHLLRVPSHQLLVLEDPRVQNVPDLNYPSHNPSGATRRVTRQVAQARATQLVDQQTVENVANVGIPVREK